MRKIWVLFLMLFVGLNGYASSRKQPRYIFSLPAGFVGWIQIIFNDPQATPLCIKDGGVLITVPESGIARTSNLRIHSDLAEDEFRYRSQRPDENLLTERVPAGYVLPGIDHGGFGVMDTGGKGSGYLWFIFIGPSVERKQVPFADWNEVVATQKRMHGNAKVPAPKTYPSPGRVQLESPGLSAHANEQY
jgi:hypothetical protein